MKILYVMTALPPSTGGAQTHLFEIAKRIKRNHEVQGLCHWTENRTDWLQGVTNHAPGDNQYTLENIPVLQMNLDPDSRRRLFLWSRSYYLTMGTSVDKISEALFLKMDRTVGAVDLVHAGRIGREFLCWAAYKFAKKRGIPFVLTPFHHPQWGGWRWRYYTKLYKLADAVMALTNAEKEILQGLGVHKEKIHVVGHAPHISSLTPKTEYFGKGGPVVLFLGQKYKYKGIEQLVKAMPFVWQKYPETRFAFIGPRTDYSRKLFSSIQDNRVIEVDRVSEQDKVSALSDCTVFCLPSRQESFGGVYAEAWLFKKPVIGGNIPAIADVIDHDVNGYLTGPSSIELSEKLRTLLASNEKRLYFGEQGLAKVNKCYTWEKITARQEKIYQSV